jgi:sugar/nucleoside kinase (ribokinase family)
MSLLVTGSIGIDTLETPEGRVEGVLGGSAVHFSLAASHFTDVRMVAVVGEDFDMSQFAPLKSKKIDVSGVEQRPGSQTFRWHGKYVGDMAEAETVAVDLNVLAEKGAVIPDRFLDSRCVFLANTHPTLQREVAERFADAQLIVCDTMNLWIETELDELKKTLQTVHGLVLNDGEARLLTGIDNLHLAAHEILKLGPRFAVIKKGAHGSLLATKDDDFFSIPAYPTIKVVDPTGCGDSFAGAMMGYLDRQNRFDGATLRSAMARGSVVASYVIESFSIDAGAAVTPDMVEQRLEQLKRMTVFE